MICTGNCVRLRVGLGLGVNVGVAVGGIGVSDGVSVGVGVLDGVGVSVGVAVGGIGVAVGGMGVAVGGMGVLVGTAVAGSPVASSVTSVSTVGTTAVSGGGATVADTCVAVDVFGIGDAVGGTSVVGAPVPTVNDASSR
jgi:hypothetical protein